MSDIAKVPSHNSPYMDLPSICSSLFEAKARKGLTFDQIGKAINRDEVWVAAAFYGQAKMTLDELAKLSESVGLEYEDLRGEIGEHWWPNRGNLGPNPLTDPLIYRLHEGIIVYGHAIKAVIHEKFGDGIMSMVNCKINIEKKTDPNGDRVFLTFDGKFMPYPQW